MKRITNSLGQYRYVPSLEDIQEADEDCCGFCVFCGNMQGGVEPDARKYVCDECDKAGVYGAQELVLMGFVS